MHLAHPLASIVLVLSSMFVPSVTSWTLYADPETVDLANAYKVEIFCHNGQSKSLATFKLVKSVHITKFNADGGSHSIASFDSGTGTTTIGDVYFKGNRYEGGLLIYSTNLSHALGKYGCVITGLDKSDRLIQESLPPVTIREKRLTNGDVLAQLQQIDRQLRNYTNGKISALENTIRDLESQVLSNFTYISDAVGEIGAKLDAGLKDLYEKVKETQKQINVRLESRRPWPRGNYALYEPLSGCPSSAWKEEWTQFETKSPGPSRNYASQGNHFQAPLFFRRDDLNIANLRYCVHSDNTSLLTWPSGSYCIMRSEACPPQFKFSSLRFDLEDKDVWYNYTKNLDVTFDNDFVYLYFCCRYDSRPTNPITLPVNKPFYLYSNGGVCQEVKGMTNSREFMRIYSEEYNNGDQFTGDYHPDASLNPVTLYLCYYSPIH